MSTNLFIQTIISDDPTVRNRSFNEIVANMPVSAVLTACRELEIFRHNATNLYERVRATHFLYAAYRFVVMESPDILGSGIIPQEAFRDLYARKYEQAIAGFSRVMLQEGSNAALISALAMTYHHLTFQTLADQVRRSVRANPGNQWMFRVGHADDHAVRIQRALLQRGEGSRLYPILMEETAVRLDLSHSGWSDIFFLGMDYPEGARVLNISVDLGVYGRNETPRPPIATYLRVITEPVIRLSSIDLQVTKDISDLQDLFNFGNDHLSLLKAGVIASGIIPPSFEGTEQPLAQVLARVIAPGMGLELVTNINDIPKGSRLAVSTNLLASIISLMMRATGQIRSFTGQLSELERRLIASRAILGEWLGGSGGGWQDSGGIWPGIKVIGGAVAQPGDPEFGISAGRLLPQHHLLTGDAVHAEFAQRLANSLVLVHGGLTQNVGPILEMVTEKYLLRAGAEWQARQSMRHIFDQMLSALQTGDVRSLARLTTENWEGPLQTIIPWVSNRFTELMISRTAARLGKDYWGFLMLGGMSGGGMGIFTAPERSASFRQEILTIMQQTKEELAHALPFAMDPLVYTFNINTKGSCACLQQGADAVMPDRYYALQVPELVHQQPEQISYLRRAELDHFTTHCIRPDEAGALLRTMVSNLFRVSDPASQEERMVWDAASDEIKSNNGFDAIQHEQLRVDLRSGRIGLSHNRLPAETEITDINDDEVLHLQQIGTERARGEQALRAGSVAMLSLAGGLGSRWTHGAGVIKALNPFVTFQGTHRNFIEIHLAKTRKRAVEYQVAIPHIISTSYLTHTPIAEFIQRVGNRGNFGPILLSPGRSIAQRLIPMVRDLVFLWEELAEESLDEQKEKIRTALRASLLDWAHARGEGSDYIDNIPIQRFNPPGHWYEVANLFRNGVLAQLLTVQPAIDTLLLHNIDTLGADIDTGALGAHLSIGHTLTYEVTPRRVGDHGGGLARVNGRLRLLEGLAQPREDDELRLRYYNTMTTWIQIDPLLTAFGLTREDLFGPQERITEAVRRMAQRVPTYITIKDVTRRWGQGQEDIYPVAQFEKLWGDMSALSDLSCGYLVVPRQRGQQLKGPEELDAWVNDGSKAFVQSLCDFG